VAGSPATSAVKVIERDSTPPYTQSNSLIAAVLLDYYTRNETDIVVFISYSNTGRGQLADSRHLPRHVQLRETDDVGATFTDERSMLYDGHALSLTGVENEPRSVIARFYVH